LTTSLKNGHISVFEGHNRGYDQNCKNNGSIVAVLFDFKKR